MKSSSALVIGTVLMLAGLAGCGQTGPLYMPTPPAKAAKPAPAPAQTAPTPPTSPAAQ